MNEKQENLLVTGVNVMNTIFANIRAKNGVFLEIQWYDPIFVQTGSVLVQNYLLKILQKHCSREDA
jgi:hypothetical protein